jgi:hypothetical protein
LFGKLESMTKKVANGIERLFSRAGDFRANAVAGE